RIGNGFDESCAECAGRYSEGPDIVTIESSFLDSGVNRAVVNERSPGMGHELTALVFSHAQYCDLTAGAGYGIGVTVGAAGRVVNRAQTVVDSLLLLKQTSICIEVGLVHQPICQIVESRRSRRCRDIQRLAVNACSFDGDNRD